MPPQTALSNISMLRFSFRVSSKSDRHARRSHTAPLISISAGERGRSLMATRTLISTWCAQISRTSVVTASDSEAMGNKLMEFFRMTGLNACPCFDRGTPSNLDDVTKNRNQILVRFHESTGVEVEIIESGTDKTKFLLKVIALDGCWTVVLQAESTNSRQSYIACSQLDLEVKLFSVLDEAHARWPPTRRSRWLRSNLVSA